MAFFSNSKLVGVPLPSITRDTSLPISKRPVIQAVRSKRQKSQLTEVFNISRRDTLQYLTAEILVGFSTLPTDVAEARVGRLEMKKMIIEKLKKLREKAGLSKPRSANEMETPPEQSSPKETKLPPLVPPVPFPNPREGPIAPLVEAIVP